MGDGFVVVGFGCVVFVVSLFWRRVCCCGV